jgi:hypothetical protein
MKLNALKKALKEVVREVIQEELKEILLEAVKGHKIVQPQQMVESTIPTSTPQTPIINSQPSQMSSQEKRDAYKNILGETAGQFTSQHAQNFAPNPNQDVVGGKLPEGSVGLDQIMGLMNK